MTCYYGYSRMWGDSMDNKIFFKGAGPSVCKKEKSRECLECPYYDVTSKTDYRDYDCTITYFREHCYLFDLHNNLEPIKEERKNNG